jgi:RimJ/RimL family protein N-acetyltransferase
MSLRCGRMPLPLATPRLLIDHVREEELPELLGVYLSNPAYLELTEGAGGEPGSYDLARLERDYAMAQMTPGRGMAAVRLREGRRIVGVLDWMDENPSDGYPWLGLVMVHAEEQRRGLGREAASALFGELAARGFAAVREGVVEGNELGMALARSLGFTRVGETTMRLAAGERRVTILERPLSAPGAP